MFFRQLLHEEKSCASYVIGCTSRGVCMVIDPQGDPNRYIALAREHAMNVIGVLETHVHADHISCARDLATIAQVPYYLGSGAEVHYPYTPLSDGEVIAVGNRRIKVLHTPGHTPEHVCFVVDDWFVLTGDTLFVGDVGRVDLSITKPSTGFVEDQAGQLYTSLQRLLALPDVTEIYPGHFAGSVCGRGMDGKPISTIGRERTHNKALRMSALTFRTFQTENLPPVPLDFHSIKRQNIGQQ